MNNERARISFSFIAIYIEYNLFDFLFLFLKLVLLPLIKKEEENIIKDRPTLSFTATAISYFNNKKEKNEFLQERETPPPARLN
jgi:hypothetical protein